MKCKYCDKDFDKKRNAQKYCSKYCADRMRIIQKRIIGKKKCNTYTTRECKGCGKIMKFYNMRLYCKKCKMIRA